MCRAAGGGIGDLFATEPVDDSPDFVSFQLGSCRLEICLADPKSPASAGGSVGYWLVEDINAAIAAARAIGAEIHRGPLRVPELRRTIVVVRNAG